MKITKLFTALAFSFSLLQAVGFDNNTTITLSSGRLKPIKELKVGDEVVCYNKNLLPESSAIKGIFEITEDSSIEITTEENIILNASKTERFFLPKENAWVCAKDLKEGDCLLNEDFKAVKITKVVQQDGQRKFFVITVDTHHNFLASEGKYLVHNGPFAASQAYWTTKISLYAALGITIGGAAVAGGHIAYAGFLAVGSASSAGGVVVGTTKAIGGTLLASSAGTAAGVGTIAEVGGVVVTSGLLAAGAATETAVVVGTVTSVGGSAIGTAVGGTAVTGGICASAAAAIEAAALAAGAAAFVCPYTPW